MTTTDKKTENNPLELDPDDHVSSEDEDFNPNAPTTAALDDSAASSSESDSDAEASISTPKKSKKPIRTKKTETTTLDLDENSGDEAIIQRGKRRKTKAAGDDDIDFADDDEGSEGGLIKTRAQRAREYVRPITRVVWRCAS